jgi:hypothetical protein
LKESAKETCEADSFLVEIVDTAEVLIGGDPRSSSDFAQSTTEGTDRKGFVDIDATMPDSSYYIVADSDVGWIRRIAVQRRSPDAWKLVDVMVDHRNAPPRNMTCPNLGRSRIRQFRPSRVFSFG